METNAKVRESETEQREKKRTRSKVTCYMEPLRILVEGQCFAWHLAAAPLTCKVQMTKTLRLRLSCGACKLLA